MNMKISLNKAVALLLCFALLVTISIQPQVFAKKNDLLDENIEVLVNNDKQIKIRTEKDGIKAIMTMDKETNEITLKTNEKSKKTKKKERDYKVVVEEATEDKLEAVFIDMETNEEYQVDSDKVQASFAFLAPLGVVIGEALLAHLLAISAAIIIGGITYTLASEIAATLKTKKYDHYAAYLDTSKGVYIGAPISLSTAASRLNGSNVRTNNVWSKSSNLAQKVAVTAGGGRTAVYHPPHGAGYLPHFHKWNRSGGHSFFTW